MAAKHEKESDEVAPDARKPKHGFRVGPENLPDGPWRRKVTKIKKELIHKAKVKKAYAKIKARDQQTTSEAAKGNQDTENATAASKDTKGSQEPEEPKEQIHPTRTLMLADEAKAQTNAVGELSSDGHRRRTRRPGYYEKQLDKASQMRVDQEERQKEYRRRQEERLQKIAERERYKKAMAKTRDRNGNKKLGRESSLLLDKVKRLVAEKK